MRCLFGPTQYRYQIPSTTVPQFLYILVCKKKAQATFFLTLKNILLLPLESQGFFGELPIKWRGLRGLLFPRFAEIYRAGLVDGNAMRLLRKATATAIAKLQTVTVATNGSNNRRQQLLSLKLRGSICY